MKPGEMVSYYLKLRDKKKEIIDRQKEELKPYNDALYKIETALMQHLNDTGTKNMATADGTAYIAERTSTKVEDWSAFFAFVMENERFDMLEHRAAKSAVEEFLEDQGSLPPGLSISRENTVQVRKS